MKNNAYRSTEVSFMENKVNKITLNVPLPCAANDLTSKFKIQELDILYKESDQTSIKVVDSIPVEGSIAGEWRTYINMSMDLNHLLKHYLKLKQ